VVSVPGAREALHRMKSDVPQLRDVLLLPGCGHWIQQERPAEVSAAMISFLGGLGQGSPVTPVPGSRA
jgi:pimeloyl-ACP methyl ester carboxylesterase